MAGSLEMRIAELLGETALGVCELNLHPKDMQAKRKAV